jgi:hypothetical protein
MIFIESIWSYDNGYHGILDFTVTAPSGGNSNESKLSLRAVERFDGSISFIHEYKLNDFVRVHSDDPLETFEWLRRVLAWHLAFHRIPALVINTA